MLELIGEWIQSKDDKYEKAEASEKALDLTLKKDHLEEVKKEFDKFKSLYKGNGDELFQADVFYVADMWLGRKLSRFSEHGNRNMRNEWNRVAQLLHNHFMVRKTYKDRVFLFSGRRNAVFWCSEGDLTKPECRTLIGYQMYEGRLYPDRKMRDPTMAAADRRSFHYGLFRAKKDGKIVRFNFTNHRAASEKAYEAIWKSREYETGVMAHTRDIWMNQPRSKINDKIAPNQKNWDVYEMIAEYAQSDAVGSFKGEGAKDEKSAGYTTIKEVNEARDACKKKIKELYKGQGERLNTPSTMAAVVHNKITNRLHFLYWHARWTLKEHYNVIGD